MEVKASLKHARVSAQKARLVADMIRGQDVSEAIRVLTFLNKKTAGLLKKLVEICGFLLGVLKQNVSSLRLFRSCFEPINFYIVKFFIKTLKTFLIISIHSKSNFNHSRRII